MQIVENTYDLEANLAVLKLYVHIISHFVYFEFFIIKTLIIAIYFRYQFNPAHFNARVVAKILLKSMMNLPETHLILCTALIDHKFVSIISMYILYICFGDNDVTLEYIYMIVFYVMPYCS